MHFLTPYIVFATIERRWWSPEPTCHSVCYHLRLMFGIRRVFVMASHDATGQ